MQRKCDYIGLITIGFETVSFRRGADAVGSYFVQRNKTGVRHSDKTQV